MKALQVEPIRRIREKYKKVVMVVKEIKKVGVKILKGDKWYIERELVLKEEKLYVLKNRLHYNILVAEHGCR